MSELIEAREDALVTLTMNRPDVMNALNDGLIDALIEAFERLSGDGEVGAILLTGAGKAFCAGGDIKDMAGKGDRTFEQRVEQIRHKQRAALAMHRCSKPIVAAVNGAAMGAGLSIALMADFRIVGKSSKFATSFGAVGFSGDFGINWTLTRLVGPAKARELMMLNPRLTADDADQLGLVTRLVGDDQLMSEASGFARSLAAGPRLAWSYIKRNLNAAESAPLAELLDTEAQHLARCGMTDDHAEARAAFVEKRAARFTGR